jgi:hypothetical protein
MLSRVCVAESCAKARQSKYLTESADFQTLEGLEQQKPRLEGRRAPSIVGVALAAFFGLLLWLSGQPDVEE